MKRVTVIIPTYNYAAYIAEAIASVQAQTYPVHEIIVVDDGSTDDTQVVLNGIDDRRLINIRTKNSGVSAARNTGLEAATGDYLSFLDADDRWTPRKTEYQVRLLD